jgi:hypothetical protein
MANYTTLKDAIQEVIKTNGNNEITGALLQQSLLAMVDSLGVGYQFMGVATPETNPGTPDQRVFYIAGETGSYPNFGVSVDDPGIYVFYYSESWQSLPVYLERALLEMALIQEDGICFIDNFLNIGVKIDTNGLDSINLLKFELL